MTEPDETEVEDDVDAEPDDDAAREGEESAEAPDSTQPSASRRRLFIAMPYIAILVVLLLIEGTVRLAKPRLSTLEVFVQAPQQQASFTDKEKVTIFEGDPELTWRLRRNLNQQVWDFTVVTTNSQHLRHDGDIGSKNPGMIRVVCVGDSITFGYRVPVVWPERPKDFNPTWLPFAGLLEKKLREANPGREIEVIPLAVPGYTSFQGLRWLERDIENLKPDLVTLCFGWNDVGLVRQPDSVAMQTTAPQRFVRRLMEYSQAVTHFVSWLQSRKKADYAALPATTPRVPQGEFVDNFVRMTHLARNNGASVVVLSPMYRDKETNPGEADRVAHHRDALRSAMQGQGVPFLEIREFSEANFPANKSVYGELIHPNHDGHRLIASELLKLISAQGLLKGITVPSGL